jgi:acetolactate synthase-1/2/3 large subunit
MTSASKGVAEGIATALAKAGTGLMFGVPGGGGNLEMVGAFERSGGRFVLAHAETASALMAATYGEITGRPGVCVVTRGPGAASAVNGVAHALLDRAPMLLITDAVPQDQAGRISHQRLDQVQLFKAVTKLSVRVGADKAEASATAALELASEPPWGPVHLDVDPTAKSDEMPSRELIGKVVDDTGKVRDLIARCRSPVVALGVGARNAIDALRQALGPLTCPILTTYKAKGFVPESWPIAAGLLTGASIEAAVLESADLIIAIGVDPVELIPAEWSYRAPVVVLGEWPQTERYFDPDAELIGPLPELLENIAALRTLPARETEPRADYETVLGRLNVRSPGLRPQDVVIEARAAAPATSLATIDSGAHMLVAMPLWKTDEPSGALISSGLATMGFALPAAIAAALERPESFVVCMTGDAGLGMTLAELETVSRFALPIVVIVFNDSALSLIEIKQLSGQGGPGAVRYRDSNFASIARAVGIEATQVRDRKALTAALDVAFARSRPFLIDAIVDPSGYGDVLEAIRGRHG